jgi:hypothetical protein
MTYAGEIAESIVEVDGSESTCGFAFGVGDFFEDLDT